MRASERLGDAPTGSRPARPPLSRAPGASARGRGVTPAAALALQRLAGNRVTGRVLARWTKHPDPEKKGMMVPDVVAEELLRFNPPQNK
jgi:hypothetical protein